MEKAIFFDAGPIISLVMSRLVHLLPQLKKQFQGTFYITPAVKRELIIRPLEKKRFELEALEVMKLIREGILEVYENIPQRKVHELINLANSSFKIKNKAIDVVQEGEMESVAAALQLKAAVVIDERTLRLFIESSKDMKNLLEQRFKKEITTNEEKISLFSKQFSSLKIIRSVELVSTAYKLGFLNDYLPHIKKGREVLLDAALWATKFNGCAVTEHEIEEIKNFLLK